MFLAALTAPQKEAFLALADRLIRADGILTPQEEAALAAMRGEMGLPADAAAPALDVAEAAATFPDHRARMIVLLELAVLAAADHDVADAEEDLLHQVAAAFGLDEAAVMQARDWAIRQVAMVAEAAALMAEDPAALALAEAV